MFIGILIGLGIGLLALLTFIGILIWLTKDRHV